MRAAPLNSPTDYKYSAQASVNHQITSNRTPVATAPHTHSANMKCTIVVVVLAAWAVCAVQSSVVPLLTSAAWGLPAATLLHGGLVHSGLHGLHGVHGVHDLHGIHGVHGLHGHDDGQWVDDVHHHHAGAWLHGHEDGQWIDDTHVWDGHHHGHHAAVVAHAHHAVPVHVAHEG